MKKLALLFTGLSLLAITGCNDDDTPELIYPITGTWQPVKEVITVIPIGGGGVSDEITYSSCQQESRWVFNENNSGKRTDNDEAGTPAICTVVSDRNFTYVYDKREKDIEIKYQGTMASDKGKVTLLNDNSLNLKIEDTTNPNEYQSVTYTFKRIP
ncbi:lipocalin family protein [Chryseobacterium sp.]|uniref:lipocalin family protein n=1 Tax=Chryseobacterium sp. TaxID=1871047 RepID=UPI0025B99CF6|nr:lipocalin family protein [Chryseobacterium sp.]